MKTRMRMTGMLRALRATLFLTALAAAAADGASAQTEQRVVVRIEPSQTVGERVSDEVTAKELKKEAEERIAAEESARAAALNPRALLKSARTFSVSSGTSFFEPVLLEDELRERAEAEPWPLALLGGDWEKRKIADVLVHVDRPVFTYTFTYQLTHRSSGVVLATGKVTAFDGNAAAPKLARRIMEDIKLARGELRPGTK
ncbi:MAG TPA: hypothetical protein VEY09_13295 [Pyrinomonadaceae bacterium]|nr:hypothetical protein [Pyrinomonadaceae bacterium]